MDMTVVDLSRLQFALTALYHFLFVPLTIGLAVLIAIMESVYVMTRLTIWRDMTRFWGLLFGINFAMGVATGITMEFQFGTNWAYYSHYVGDIFGTPLAIEGMMAFFLEATFVGLFYFGWDRLTPVKHLMCTWALALATNFSALWILVANGWMNAPVGAHFNPDTMRMEIVSLWEVFFNVAAQAKFVHTVSAAYVTGSMFVMSISAWYLLNNRNVPLARRSVTVAASFGLASALSVVVLGDESGYTASEHQRMKIAAIEAEWETHPPPAGFNVIAIPNTDERRNDFEIKVPWVMGLIVTRSLNGEVPGIKELVARSHEHFDAGLTAYRALQVYRADPGNARARAVLDEHGRYMGYALLLRKHREDVENATRADIERAAWDLVPTVPVLFYSFRIMVALGLYFIAFFAFAVYLTTIHGQTKHRWFLRAAFFSLPLPWVAAELGWIVAEVGRQPWVVEGILPTFMGVSSITAGQVTGSLIAFVVFYTALAVIDVWLMIKYVRRGPEGALESVALPGARTPPANPQYGRGQ